MKKPEEILKQNPGSVIFARYAERLAQEGEAEKAIAVLEKGLEANPSYAFGHSVLANILRGRQIPKRVTGEFQKALELDPQSPGDMFNLGHHYLEINQPEKALRYLELALKFEPGHSGLREIYEDALDKSKAIVDLGLSDETTGALTTLFGAEEKEEQGVEFEVEISDEEQKDSGFGDMPGEETESVDFEEAEEELFAQPEDMAGVETGFKTVSTAAAEETELLSEEEGASEYDDISSLMKTFREDEGEAGEPEVAATGEKAPEMEAESEKTAADDEDDIDWEILTEEPAAVGEMAEEAVELAPAGEYVIEEEELAGDEDLESLMESFGGEDVNIEEPDRGIDGDDSDTFQQDVTNLLEKIDEEVPAVEETQEKPEAPFTVDVDEEYMDDLPDFQGIEVADKEPVQYDTADENGARLLEIDETGNYDPSQFESELLEGEPVLSEDERNELLRFEKAEDEDTMIEPDTGDTDIMASGRRWDLPLKNLLEDEDMSKEEKPESPVLGVIFSDLSMEEIDVLSEQETLYDEGAPDLESETSEGIDYSDVLAEAAGEKSPDIEETLNETQLYDEQIGSGEEEHKGLSYSDKMILDIGEVAPHAEEELLDFSMFSGTEEIELEVSDESAVERESGSGVSDDVQIEPETRIESTDEQMKTVHRVEEIIKQAPDFELSIDRDDDFLVDTDVRAESVDHLLDEYLKTLNETSGDFEFIGDERNGDGKASFETAINEEENSVSSWNLKNVVEKDATATMAEIYVSQGFVSQGIDIYRILVQDNPGNEQYKSRLSELESIHEQSSESL